jgi:hypothetical protein
MNHSAARKSASAAIRLKNSHIWLCPLTVRKISVGTTRRGEAEATEDFPRWTGCPTTVATSVLRAGRTSGLVRRRLDQDRDQVFERTRHGRSKRARGGVDMLEGRPDAFRQRDDALAGAYGIALPHGLYLARCRLQTRGGLRRAAPAERAGAHAGLECPFVGRASVQLIPLPCQD